MGLNAKRGMNRRFLSALRARGDVSLMKEMALKLLGGCLMGVWLII